MAGTVQGAIDEVLGGRIEAYAEIVRAHQDEIWRIASYALRDTAATEDLVQKVFVKAYANLGSYDAERDFGAWLRSIARNLVWNETRQALREKEALRAYRAHLAERLGNDAESEGHEARLHEALRLCRDRLSPDADRALDLRYTRSLGFAEIARALDRTVAATRQMLQRIRAALRRCIEERKASS